VSSIRSRSLSIVGGGRTRQTASPLPSSTFDQRRLAPLPSLSLCIFVSSTPLHALLFNPRKNVTSLSPCSPSRVDILAEQATNRRAHLLSLLVCPFPFATGSRTLSSSLSLHLNALRPVRPVPPPKKKDPYNVYLCRRRFLLHQRCRLETRRDASRHRMAVRASVLVSPISVRVHRSAR
jgi:hypothetical protein